MGQLAADALERRLAPQVPVAGPAARSRGVVRAVLVAVEVEGDERPQGRRALRDVLVWLRDSTRRIERGQRRFQN